MTTALHADQVEVSQLQNRPAPFTDSLMRWGSLSVVIAVAAVLRLWRLDRNGFGNFYYAAAVRSMLVSWTNFFFGSFDPAGFVTVDKPPVAIWIQAISAKILGFRGVSLLLPEALMGVASVVLIYHLVRRVFGASVGLLAGLMLAITPICVAVDRDNLPDSSLVFVLLLSAWALSLAAETGRLRLLLLSAALVGVGFNIKMLAAFVVLPTFYTCYFLAAPAGWKSRVAHLTIASVVLAAVSLSWAIAVELTPKSGRPYIGGSRNNSALDLALGYNGLGRVFGGSGNFGPGMRPGSRGAGTPRSNGDASSANDASTDNAIAKKEVADTRARPAEKVDDVPGLPPGGRGGPFGPGGPMGAFPGGMPPMFGGTPGLLRFTSPLMSAQITWLFPIAIVGAWVAASRVSRSWPLGRQHLSLLLWAGWLLTHWVVFSFARGIFHEYYTTIMGPAVAALAGIGTIALYQEWRDGHGRGYLPMALILTAAWQAHIVSQSLEIRRWLWPVLGFGVFVSVLGLLCTRWLSSHRPTVPWVKFATVMGLAALLIGPACWSLAAAMTGGNGMMPAAQPWALTGRREGWGGMPPVPPFGMENDRNEKLVSFLRANRHGERILVAAPASMEISSLIIHAGETAVSLGGFMGEDPVVTREEFAKMVAEGQVRFVLIGGGPGGGPPGGGPPGGGPVGGPPFGPGGPGGRSEVSDWVRENGKLVDTSLWQSDELAEEDEPAVEPNAPDAPPGPPTRNFFRRMRRMARLYDCKPDLGLVASARNEEPQDHLVRE